MPGQVIYPVPPYNNVYPKPVGDLGGGLSAVGGGGGLLSALFPPQISGGGMTPERDAQGDITDFNVTPMQAGGGFMNRLMLGRGGMQQINQLNALLQQARMQELGRIQEQKTIGEQNRLSTAFNQVDGLLKDHNLADTPENRTYLQQVLAPMQQQIQQAIAQGQLKGAQSPEGENAAASSQIANEAGPALAASKASERTVPEGGTMAFNAPGNIFGQPSILQGALPTRTTSTPMMAPSGFDESGKPTGYGIQNFPTGQESYTPGSLNQPVSQSMVDAAKSMNFNNAGLQGNILQPNPLGTSTTNLMQGGWGGGSVQQPSVVPQVPQQQAPLTPYPGYGPYAGTTASQPFSIVDILKQMIQGGNIPIANDKETASQTMSGISPAY